MAVMEIIMISFYDVLGIKKDATEEKIRKALNDYSKAIHPDANKGSNADEMMKNVNKMREILLNPKKRREYDESLEKSNSNAKYKQQEHENLKRQAEIYRREMEEFERWAERLKREDKSRVVERKSHTPRFVAKNIKVIPNLYQVLGNSTITIIIMLICHFNGERIAGVISGFWRPFRWFFELTTTIELFGSSFLNYKSMLGVIGFFFFIYLYVYIIALLVLEGSNTNAFLIFAPMIYAGIISLLENIFGLQNRTISIIVLVFGILIFLYDLTKKGEVTICDVVEE